MSATLNLIRWAGGKGKQLKDLLPIIPDSDVYVEPFGGGASVLLNRPRQPVEVYNDLDSSLVNLFSVVRDDRSFDDFRRILGWTLYSREVFEESLGDGAPGDDPIMRAVKFYTMLNQSISGKRLAKNGDWSRARSDNVASRWTIRQEKLGYIHDRLRHVQVECRDALDVLKEWDGGDTVFYCDPPYVLETRSKKKYYAHETTDEYHRELVAVLKTVKGAVVLSGYNHVLYEPLLSAGWRADSYSSAAHMTILKPGVQRDPRQEVLWRNPQAVNASLRVPLPGLWGVADANGQPRPETLLVSDLLTAADTLPGHSAPGEPEEF